MIQRGGIIAEEEATSLRWINSSIPLPNAGKLARRPSAADGRKIAPTPPDRSRLVRYGETWRGTSTKMNPRLEVVR
jgi:hypothetical protein